MTYNMPGAVCDKKGAFKPDDGRTVTRKEQLNYGKVL